MVRRIVGYRRYEGLEAAAMLVRLYRSVRLLVNCFQPSFKLADKSREEALMKKRYHLPATPYQLAREPLDKPRGARPGDGGVCHAGPGAVAATDAHRPARTIYFYRNGRGNHGYKTKKHGT